MDNCSIPFCKLDPSGTDSLQFSSSVTAIAEDYSSTQEGNECYTNPSSTATPCHHARDPHWAGSVSAVIPSASNFKSPVPTNKKVCRYHLASYLKVPFPGTENKFPECSFKEEPLRCPACPHQDFSTWSKNDLQQLLLTAKTDFCTNAMWSTIYTGIMAAIDKLA